MSDAIDSYVKAKDPSEYLKVIDAAQHVDEINVWYSLIKFLQMARKKDFGSQETCSEIDTAMLMVYARTNMVSELEEFLSSPNIANVEEVGDRCAEMGISCEAVQMLLSSISKQKERIDEMKRKEELRSMRKKIADLIAEHGGKELLQSRVLIVGDGRVGKTSLYKSMVGEEFQMESPSTVGAVENIFEVLKSDIEAQEQ